jgi:CheY-like chemotaxis protein
MRRQTFDLIFMDLQMLEVDGREATRLIHRTKEGTRNCPLQSDRGTDRTRNVWRPRALSRCRHGEHLSKPLKKLELFTLLERISKHRNEKAPSAQPV